MPVGSTAQELGGAARKPVLLRPRRQVGEKLLLRQGARQGQRLLEAKRTWDRSEQILNPRDADVAEHRLPVGVRRRYVTVALSHLSWILPRYTCGKRPPSSASRAPAGRRA